MDNPGSSNPDDFLSSLIDTVEFASESAYFPFQAPAAIVQESELLALPPKVLDRLCSFIPLKERILHLGTTCKSLNESVKRSITSVAFFKDEMDGLSDNRLKYFLSLYGSKIKHLNFDLFRSTFIEECTQWSWRQSVISSVALCRNLRELNILVCNRHRLRDNDLLTIFRQAPDLVSLSIDAQYLNGHCFQSAPVQLNKLEMEMCYRISDTAMRSIFKMKKLKTLHMSQMLSLKDSTVYGIVSELRGLVDLSIVSHQDSTYKDLTASGLAQLARLPRLKSLCLEGMATVTDKFLTEFSEERFAANSTLRSLSLAYCFNFGSQGLQQLSRFSKLEDLNLDGVCKRDISMGLERVAKSGRLVRLLLADRANVSPDSLLQTVRTSPRLRLLDITNNEDAFNWTSANDIISYWSQQRHPQLTILTDTHLLWNMVKCVPVNGIVPVKVMHVLRWNVPYQEVLPESALSQDMPHQIPAGLLCPRLRRGNRYRVLWETLGPGKDAHEEKENSSPLMSSMVSPTGAAPTNGGSLSELAAIHFNQGRQPQSQDVQQKGVPSVPTTTVIPPFCPSRPPPPVPLACKGNRNVESNCPTNTKRTFSCSSSSSTDKSSGPGGLSMTPFNPIPPMDINIMDIPPQLPFSTDIYSNNTNSASSATLPSGFSYSSVSPSNDPHSRDWSLDVLSMLMTSHAYADGARVGPLDVKEGVVFKPDGLVSASLPSNLLAMMPPSLPITEGSGGAPRPPVEIPPQPSFHYTRGPRTSRRSLPKAAPAQPAPQFGPGDFPPLTSQ